MSTAQTEENSDSTFSTKFIPQKPRFDTVIVFGQGPIKPVFLRDEVTLDQLRHWESYRQNPYATQEPNFWLIQQPKLLSQLARIEQEEKITDLEKTKLIELKRQEWQRTGWFAMKAMGRQNALAAGYALYKGLTKQIIFTGGKTISPATAKIVSPARLAAWPSEAELMRDILISHYGDMYEKKYGKMIHDAIFIEDAATNTLENMSFVLNKYPHLLERETKVGYLSARHHLRRIKLLANVFSLQCEEDNQLLEAQELIQQSQTAVIDSASDTSFSPVDEKNYHDAQEQNLCEERLRRGLKEPEYVSYWLGYLADLKYPSVIQKTLRRLCDESWCPYAREALAKVGVDFDEYKNADLLILKKERPEKYTSFISCLRKLKSPEYRRLPSQLTLPLTR